MNSEQQAYIERLLHVLGSVTEACRHNERAEQFVGRKKVGDHVVKVTLVAERQGIGMSAPIGTHGSTASQAD